MSGGSVGAALLRVLQQFMSETAARRALLGALEPLGLNLDAVPASELPRLVAALEPATRQCVDPTRQSRMMAQLRTLLAPASSNAASVPEVRATTYLVRTEADASHARHAARQLCESLGGHGDECQKVATVVSELARNQISHAGGGTIQLSPQLAPRRLLRVSAEDSGQGIPDLERVLSGRYERKTGVGLGLSGVKRLADRFDVRTGPKGTQVDFEVWL
ncbi:ATP-binding protein [Corallococcus macrosporus]|uniref:Putative serine/threonine protein kinase n=1 Tax=Myxococcus fulvus (strain ATCC BAA-855 / HW-1) TaxID=483219 RepID=F8CG33_MYXFH|nr:ATP-binding protein [Corallococcus macrosporus]AEI66202.1 putative serine/threonine protein kinase [Corallococcus macrosporus]